MSRIIEIEVKGLDKIERLYRTVPARTKRELSKAVTYSALLIQRHARMEAPVDTGILRSGVSVQFLPLGAAIFPRAKYALAVHEGTGIYGPHKRRITPRRARVLAWRSNGGMVFARSVKGQKPNPFMERAARRSEPGVNDAFERAVKNIMEG